MKAILLVILFCKPLLGICQLSDDSLKRIFTQAYEQGRSVDCKGLREFFWQDSVVFGTMQEFFEGYFDNVHIYLVVFHCKNRYSGLDLYFFPAMYAIDMNNRKILLFKDNVAFCSFVNSTKKKITNLDKSYLYLFLFEKIFQGQGFAITTPASYPMQIRAESFFANKNDLSVFFDLQRDTFRRTHELLNSYNNNIIMYSEEDLCISPKFILYKYQFNFDKSNNLANIVIDTLR